MMVNMRLTSRSEPGPEPGPSMEDDDLDTGIAGLLRYRRLVIRVLLVIFLLLPAVGLLTSHRHSSHAGFLILATLAFVVLTDRTVLIRMPEPGRYERWQWWLLPVLVGLGAALFAVGGMAWLTPLAVASAAVGRISPDGRATVLGLACCTGIAVTISVATGLGYSNTIVAGAVVALGNLLAHSAERRNVLMYRLKETRAELARVAVAEERLRISRDLHDLLGHSLSLIALKAELAGRVIGTDPERAAREIAELETVARRSLTEVRQAVTSYRQPSLAAELVSSRRMLASAGIECQLRVPDAYSLPPAVDALLAWTVREGATNIVRHSAARHAEITIELTDTEATARLSDDGMGPRGNGLRAIANATGTVAAGAGAGAVPGGTGATGAGGAGAGGTGATGAGGARGRGGGTGGGRRACRGRRGRRFWPGRARRTGRPPGRDAVRGRGRGRRVLAAGERAADRSGRQRGRRRGRRHRGGRHRGRRHGRGPGSRPGADAVVTVRIMIAEDQTMVRQALVALLELEGDITVVAQAASGDEALAMAQRYQPDVALLDIEMPGPDGLEVARRLAKDGFGGKIVIVTTFGRPGYLAAAMAAGASGFLLKDAPAAELATAIRRVQAGERVVDPALAAAALAEGASPLTARETEVLSAARGHAAISDLAASLHLSSGTVRNHLSAAIQKLGARNRAEAVQIAERKGWL